MEQESDDSEVVERPKKKKLKRKTPRAATSSSDESINPVEKKKMRRFKARVPDGDSSFAMSENSSRELSESETDRDRELDRLLESDNSDLLPELRNLSAPSQSSRDVSALTIQRKEDAVEKQKNRSFAQEEEVSISSRESSRGLLPGVTSTSRSSQDHPSRVPSPDRRFSPVPGDGRSVSRNNNNQTEDRKRIKAEVVEKDNEVILIVHGLPKDTDWDNIKVVNSDAEEEVGDSINRLKKLKLVSVATQDKKFKKDGCYREKFRTPYTAQVKY